MSELVRPNLAATVLDGFANTLDDALFASALTLGEIRKGVEKLTRCEDSQRLACIHAASSSTCTR